MTYHCFKPPPDPIHISLRRFQKTTFTDTQPVYPLISIMMNLNPNLAVHNNDGYHSHANFIPQEIVDPLSIPSSYYQPRPHQPEMHSQHADPSTNIVDWPHLSMTGAPIPEHHSMLPVGVQVSNYTGHSGMQNGSAGPSRIRHGDSVGYHQGYFQQQASQSVSRPAQRPINLYGGSNSLGVDSTSSPSISSTMSFQPERTSSTTASATPEPSYKRTRRVPVACQECRSRKSRCDGGRPCGICLTGKRECHYQHSARRVWILQSEWLALEEERDELRKRCNSLSAQLESLGEDPKYDFSQAM